MAKLYKKMEVEMGNFVLQLPVEITTDIFSRLPVGSVIRCKLVCKAWRSFVEDPVFFDIHTHRLLSKLDAAAVTTNTQFYLTVKQLQENRQKHHFWECNNHELSNSSSSSSCFKLSKPLNAKDDDDDDSFSKRYRYHSHSIGPIGSSNGLICSYGINRRTIYVYNPCTRECIRLPPTIFSRQFKLPLLNGFGYNPLTNEYKVVLILSNRDDEEDRPLPGAEVCVYTLGSGKWRTKKLLESWSLDVSFKQGLFFNGALHWIAWELINNIDHYDIFSFDLATEEFRIIVPSPPLSKVFNNLFHVELGLWGGGCCLCVRQWNLVTKTTDIWVLMNSKDKDIKSSWTMKFKIPATTTDEPNKPRCYYYYPIALLGRDKILLYTYKVNKSVFVSYDSETGNFEDEVMDNSELQPSKSNWGTCCVTPYTKSFVSLKAFKEEEDAGLAF